VVRAGRRDEPDDIYLVRSRVSPEGRLLDVTGVYNLSDTSAVDEQSLTVGEGCAAWVITGGGKVHSVHLADLRGDVAPGPELSRLARWQSRLTDLQTKGQLAGIGRRSFRLDPAAGQVSLTFEEDQLVVSADAARIRIRTGDGAVIEGAQRVIAQPHFRTQPGNLITWAVDRVRAMPWFGSDRMQLLKTVAFAGIDLLMRALGSVTGDDGSSQVAEEMGDLLDAVPVAYTDPETGWPPAAMDPMLKPPLKGEGKWIGLDQDPFIRSNPGAPAPFVTSFIRTDPKRAFTQIYVTLWDPRQVELHIMSGTVEPKSATGETGPGIVPRREEVMGRLLAGLNGGFQATHGEWGMMAEGVVYLPPKPYAATVAELRDGAVGFGTWPRDETVPDEIVAYRQNMTPLVMDGVTNPYRRSWWGGVPPGWEDESRTVRSALCLTREGFVAYLYGMSIDADHLASAMDRARCEYGIHLDMNPGHTGLEFYLAGPAAELPPLGRPLDPRWEAEGDVPDMPGWRFRGRRMLRYMGLMNFPRYIHRESRDFFYLTLRHILPGPAIPAPLAGKANTEEGQWQVKGLPQHGWPYAIATTWVRPDRARSDTKVRLVQIDPRAVRIGPAPPPGAPTVLAIRVAHPPATGSQKLWLGPQGFAISPQAPHSGDHLVAAGTSPESPQAARASAGVCITSGNLVLYAEVATAPEPGADGVLLRNLLQSLGCRTPILLETPIELLLGGDRNLSGHPTARREGDLVLVRAVVPGARRIFRDTPIVPSSEWYPLQAKRVRYFKKPKSEPELPPAGSSQTGAPTDGPPPAAASATP
jgi:hypothetical protein